MSFEDLLKDLQGQNEVPEDPNFVPLDKLFNESFMRKYSAFGSFDEFLEKGNFQAKTREDIQNIPDELFDRHVQRETSFADWEAMLAASNQEYKPKE
ncbi:hypothetical protein J7E73_11085 [Paenibacillus albidus]|nr:hypothetical protein [Paenibacillus albidus]MBT2289668.1 hypothetical protein [Paenibacillus albidus]